MKIKVSKLNYNHILRQGYNYKLKQRVNLLILGKIKPNSLFYISYYNNVLGDFSKTVK